MKIITTLVLFTGLMSAAWASDWQCRDSNGCTAQISENGQLKTVSFRRGEIVCTEDGWIVSTETGWKKLKARKTPGVLYECEDPLGGCDAVNLKTGIWEHFRYKDSVFSDEYKIIGNDWEAQLMPNELVLQGFSLTSE